jgi:transcriptional antiterminator NusG
MSKRWYVVHAYSGYEKKVALALQERIDLLEMQDSFGDILVPTEEVVEMRAGQKRKSERKFFPGYVLVQMELSDASWHLVKETPRVMGFIGGKADKPSPITEAEANKILDRVQSDDKPRPKTVFEPGEVVPLMMVLSMTSMELLKKLIMRRVASRWLCLFLGVLRQLS